jgi:hypothetical protein
VEAAKEALAVLAIGKKLSAKMNKKAYVQQAEEESGFFAWLSEQLSSHPHLPKRINALDHWQNPEQSPLVQEKKTGIIVGTILSIVLAASLTGAAVVLLEGATALTAFLEDPYLVEDEYMYEEEMIDFPPVIQAYMNEDMDQVQQLVAEGADVNEKDSDDHTALQYAVSWGDFEAAQWFIQNGADVNTTDNWGSTPLINAIFNDADVELVELLLENGADKTIKDSEGKTAYDYAVENRDATLRDLLK